MAYAASDHGDLSPEAILYHTIVVEDNLLHVGGLIDDLARVGGKLLNLFP